MLTLGVHVSIAGKIYLAIDRARDLCCNTMQIFARNPRQFRKGALKKADVATFRKRLKEAKISPLVIHTPYTLNLAARKEYHYKVSIKEFIQDVIEADSLGAGYIVIHTGNYKGDENKGLERVVDGLAIILESTKNLSIKILLENTAGDGSSLGHTFSHHRFIFKNVRYSKRIGLCLDTAHAWCAGYKINTKQGLEALIKEINNEIGLERLYVIHLNDTLHELGSRKDRHFFIGRGALGENGIGLIVNHPKLRELPFILETPKANEFDDIINLTIVRKLYNYQY